MKNNHTTLVQLYAGDLNAAVEAAKPFDWSA